MPKPIDSAADRQESGLSSKQHHHHHHHQHKHASTVKSLYGTSDAAESSVSVVKLDDSNDHVLTVLHSEDLQYPDVEALVAGLNPQRAQDILMSYRILSTLSQYLEETDSWTFCLLNNYDFQNNVRQFDLDVAVVVGKRAEHLLAEIYAWNISRLKRMVTNFSAYYSDEATILTVLVFRVVSKYSDLEFTLQLALSRATLVKIHYEMAGLFAKLPGGAESTQKDAGSTSRHNELVMAYRHFVSQLLEEIETTPFESVQQELFQVVHDLKSMFSKFSDSQMLKSLESDSPNRDDTFFDLSSSMASLSQSTGRLPSLAEEWQGSSHNRTMSGSTTFSAMPSTKSTTFSTMPSMKSSLSEELPSMMHAFEMARHREEHVQSHQPRQAMSQSVDLAIHPQPPATSLSGQTTPPDTPGRGASHAPSEMYMTPGTNSMTSSSIISSPPSSISTAPVRTQKWTAAPAPFKPASVAGSSSALVKSGPDTGAMNVKMICNRMMIEVNGKFIDMQDWATSINSHAPQPAVTTASIPAVKPQSSSAPPPPSQPAANAVAAPSSYGLGTILQPWLRPDAKAVTPPQYSDDELESSDQASFSKSAETTKSTASKPGLAKPSSDSPLALLRDGSLPGSFRKPTRPLASGSAPTDGSAAAAGGSIPASSVSAAINSSSWIKGVIGQAESQFGKNYTTAMDFQGN